MTTPAASTTLTPGAISAPGAGAVPATPPPTTPAPAAPLRPVELAAVELLATELGAAHVATRVPQPAADPNSGAATAVRRAGSPDYRRWLDHVASAGGCARPIRLHGQLHTVQESTGAVLASRSTETLPDGVIYVPCGDRRASVCPACAETYRADTYHLIRAGLVGGKGVPESVATHPVLFATLTAPAFGPVHARAVDRKTGQVKPCRMRRQIERCRHGRVLACPKRHSDSDLTVGRPLCPQCYDYDAHAVWNAYASELWRRTTITATRALRPLARRFGVKLRLSFAKVAEYQARGAIHFHALVRLDAVDEHDPDLVVPPPAGIGTGDLEAVVRHAVASTTVTTPPHPHRPDGWTVAWGPQLDLRPVAFTGELTDTAVAGYLAKYATKATEATGHTARRLTPDTIAGYASSATHTGRLVRACWVLGRRPDEADPADWKTTYGRLRRWAHMLGFGGHFATKSRRYSTTRRALRSARRDWQRARHRARAAGFTTADHLDEETTLVVGSLTYAGAGYRTTGDQALALTAAANAREHRRAAREERTTRLDRAS